VFGWAVFLLIQQRDRIIEQEHELIVYERDLKAVIKKHNELNHENRRLRVFIVSIEKEMNECKYGVNDYE
jgi:hypothetical protein